MKSLLSVVLCVIVASCDAGNRQTTPGGNQVGYAAFSAKVAEGGGSTAVTLGGLAEDAQWTDRLGFADLVGVYRIERVYDDKEAEIYFEMALQSAPLVFRGTEADYLGPEYVGPDSGIRSQIPSTAYREGTLLLVVGWKNEYTGTLYPVGGSEASVFVLDDQNCVHLRDDDACLPLGDLLTVCGDWMDSRSVVTDQVATLQFTVQGVGEQKAMVFEAADRLVGGLKEMGLGSADADLAGGSMPPSTQYLAFSIPKNREGDSFQLKETVISGTEGYVRIDKFFGDGPSISEKNEATIIVMAIADGSTALNWHSVVFQGE